MANTDYLSEIYRIMDINKINRFTSFLDNQTKSDKVIKFYNEVLLEIEKMVKYISQIEEDNRQLHIAFQNQKELHLQLQLYIAMTFYCSNSGKGAILLNSLSKEVDNYFIKEERYYTKMKELINYARTSE